MFIHFAAKSRQPNSPKNRTAPKRRQFADTIIISFMLLHLINLTRATVLPCGFGLGCAEAIAVPPKYVSNAVKVFIFAFGNALPIQKVSTRLVFAFPYNSHELHKLLPWENRKPAKAFQGGLY